MLRHGETSLPIWRRKAAKCTTSPGRDPSRKAPRISIGRIKGGSDDTQSLDTALDLVVGPAAYLAGWPHGLLSILDFDGSIRSRISRQRHRRTNLNVACTTICW